MKFTTSARPTAFVTWTSFLLLACALLQTAQAADAVAWRQRSIYQIITDRFALQNGSTTVPCSTDARLYCGGNFQGVIGQLDYIQGMGFTAIWISPVVKNIQNMTVYGEPYHGFWSLDINTINANFGSGDDLRALSKALHDRDMLLMVDVVLNNMAYMGAHTDVVYTYFVPFNSPAYYHPFCNIDYNNWTNAALCWLGDDNVSLPDLNTELPLVQSTFNQWGLEMVKNYSIDGFRVDAAKHVDKPFWASFQPAVGVYMVGEVYDARPEWVCSYESNTEALDGVLNYALYWSIAETMPNVTQSMQGLLAQYDSIYENCQDVTLLGTFSENQDISRFANLTTDLAQRKNALAFILLTEGIPIVYYGAEQGFATGGDPWNREALWLSGYNTNAPLYQLIKACNTARNAIAAVATYTYWTPYWTWKTTVLVADDNVLGIRKGYDVSILSFFTNKGSSAPAFGPYTVGNTNFQQGDVIVDLISCQTMTVGQYGVVTITVPAGGNPMVWTTARYVYNTTLCPSLNLAQYKNAKPVSIAVISSPAVITSPSALSVALSCFFGILVALF